MSIKELLDKTEPVDEGSSWFKDLIEKAKARPSETVPFEMFFGDTVAEVVLTEVRGFTWGDIATHAPRPGNTEDAKLGCNADRLLERYPVDHITIAGENPTVDEWLQVVHLIDAPFRSDIVTALWWMHWGLPMKRLQDAKAKKEAEK